MTGYHQYKICIEACLRCAAICNHCAANAAKENHDGMMAKCIQLSMECSAICYAAAQLMSLGSDRIKDICKLCAEMCDACAAECSSHENEHCQECAEACTKCADECEVV
ncbi:MAG: four-helix bundle copper-binding protein [Ferruginibacter sp.]|nr:four-helix bundle copper-binding protein [Ferruginibacter sp.]